MPSTTWLAAVLRAPASFQEKETGAVWRSEEDPSSVAVDR